MYIKKTRTQTIVGIGAIGMLLLSSCSSANSSESGTEDFVYDVGAPNSTVAMAPYTSVPNQMGYWDDQDLNVDVVFSDGSSTALQSVVGGTADIAVVGTNTIYSAAAQNPELRIVSLTPGNQWRIAVPESSDIDEPADLAGTTIGVHSMTSGTYQFGLSIAKSAGVEAETDIEWLPIGTGNQAAEAIESGRVDAYSSYDGPLDQVNRITSEKLRPVEAPLDDVAGSLAYVVTAETLEERPEAVEKFLRGTYQGYAFSEFNPEAAVQIYWQEHQDQKPTDIPEDEAINEAVETSAALWETRARVGDDGIWGYLNDENVRQASDYFTEFELVEAEVDPSEIVDMSITQQASEFDETAIQEDSESWDAES